MRKTLRKIGWFLKETGIGVVLLVFALAIFVILGIALVGDLFRKWRENRSGNHRE